MPKGHIVEAKPRTPEQIMSLQDCPEILAAARLMGTMKIVHFTTLHGCVGVLAVGAVKSRHRLPQDSYLEHVYRPNAAFRKDKSWLDYVNLSIERINAWMFETSSRWHADEDNPWVVLSFHPRILAHAGVVIATTNNICPACNRAEGLAGFKQMFADRVVGRCGQAHFRNNKRPEWPTDRQAEVLYPYELSCEHLQRIFVQNEDVVDEIKGALAGLNLTVDVRHAPEVFE